MIGGEMRRDENTSNQICIFSLSSEPSIKEAQKAYLSLPRKRIHNKKPTYTKSYTNYIDAEGNIFDDVNTWGRMSQFYNRLSSFFPIVNTHSDIIDVGIVRSYRNRYIAEKYEYKNFTIPNSKYEIFTGQNFTERQAEIIGSELLSIEERLFLHSELLEALENGYRIEECNRWIERLLNLVLQGYSARIIILALVYCFPRCDLL